MLSPPLKFITFDFDDGFCDFYRNYVVQFVMDLNIPSATSTLVSQFQGSYVYLSMQKFSSHVVEKCLIVGNDEDRSKIIHELLASSLFEQLLRDPLANYVIQKALEFSQVCAFHHPVLIVIFTSLDFLQCQCFFQEHGVSSTFV